MPRLPEPTVDRVASGLLVSTALIALTGGILTVVVWGDLAPADAYPTLGSALAGVVYATLGALIVRRARKDIGRSLQGVGLGLACPTFASRWRGSRFPRHTR